MFRAARRGLCGAAGPVRPAELATSRGLTAHSDGATVGRCLNTSGVGPAGPPVQQDPGGGPPASRPGAVRVVPVSAWTRAGSSVAAVITVSTAAGTAELPVRLEVALEADPDIAGRRIWRPP